jgi:hypothetical protein
VTDTNLRGTRDLESAFRFRKKTLLTAGYGNTPKSSVVARRSSSSAVVVDVAHIDNKGQGTKLTIRYDTIRKHTHMRDGKDNDFTGSARRNRKERNKAATAAVAREVEKADSSPSQRTRSHSSDLGGLLTPEKPGVLARSVATGRGEKPVEVEKNREEEEEEEEEEDVAGDDTDGDEEPHDDSEESDGEVSEDNKPLARKRKGNYGKGGGESPKSKVSRIPTNPKNKRIFLAVVRKRRAARICQMYMFESKRRLTTYYRQHRKPGCRSP